MLRLLLGATVLLALSVAHADNDAAKLLFERASVQFRLGQFHDAAMTYQKVYELHHDPGLLYDCAQSLRLAGESEAALLFYRSYLAAKPDAENRDEVLARIDALQKVVAEQKQATERAQSAAGAAPLSSRTPTDGAEHRPGRAKRLGGVALLAIAAGATVAGVVAAVLQTHAYDAINDAAKAGATFDPSQQSAAKADTVAAGVLFGVAGAAAIAGGVLVGLGVREGRAHRRVALTPLVSPSLLGAAVSARF